MLLRGSPTANEQRKYEPAFKAEAVRLVQEQGRALADAARSLDVHVSTLHGWVREAATGGKRVHRPEADDQLRRLERELTRVTEERDGCSASSGARCESKMQGGHFSRDARDGWGSRGPSRGARAKVAHRLEGLATALP